MNEEKDLKPEENETEPQAPVTEEETKLEQPTVETITEEAVDSAAPEEPSTEEGAEQPEAVLEEPAVPEEVPAGEGAEQPEASVEEPAAVEEPEPAPTVVYRWNYGEQRQYDEQIRRKKEGRRSRLAFFGIVSCAFLVVIGLLIGVLAFRDYFVPKRQSTDTVTISKTLLPSTVLITATKGTTGASGSGFFVREDGYIVTNYHVVENMDTIKVKLYGELLKKEATLVGYNAECDIAVLKIQGSGYPAVTFGDSSAMRVGDIAIAIGNPAGSDAQWTVTQGIMSSVDRRLLLTGTAENAQVVMEPVNFSRLAEGEALPFESMAFEAGLEIVTDIEEGVEVEGNRSQLGQLVSILLDNAIRHSKGGKEIALSLKKVHKNAVLTIKKRQTAEQRLLKNPEPEVRRPEIRLK